MANDYVWYRNTRDSAFVTMFKNSTGSGTYILTAHTDTGSIIDKMIVYTGTLAHQIFRRSPYRWSDG